MTAAVYDTKVGLLCVWAVCVSECIMWWCLCRHLAWSEGDVELSHIADIAQVLKQVYNTVVNTASTLLLCHILLHQFNVLDSWVSRYQKVRTILDFNEARDDGISWTIYGSFAPVCRQITTHQYLTSKFVVVQQQLSTADDGILSICGSNLVSC